MEEGEQSYTEREVKKNKTLLSLDKEVNVQALLRLHPLLYTCNSHLSIWWVLCLLACAVQLLFALCLNAFASTPVGMVFDLFDFNKNILNCVVCCGTVSFSRFPLDLKCLQNSPWVSYLSFGICRLKAAEECFRQVKEKSAYSVKPKHASGIVSWLFSFIVLNFRDFIYLFFKSI